MIQEKIKKIYSAIQQIKENELTKTIIKPTLERLGFLKVEFYGGTDEEGKDLLCWKKDPLGETTLIVAQVKHFKFSNKATGKSSFQNIVNQLTTSLLKEVQYSDKSVHFPEYVYLISSYEIDSKNIKSRFSVFPNLNQDRIKIIDGYKLSELILKNCPELVSILINEEIDLSYYSTENLNNSILLKALGFDKQINLKSIYTDIDFSLGKHTTQLFFNTEFDSKIEYFSLQKHEWENFKSCINKLSDEIIGEIIDKKIEEIELEYENQIIELKKWEEKNNSLKSELAIQEDVFKKAIDRNKTEWNTFRIKENEYNELIKQKIKKEADNSELSERLNKELNVLNNLKNKLRDIINEEVKINKLTKIIDSFLLKRPNPRFAFHLDGKKLETILLKDKIFIKDEIKKFNKNRPSREILKKYLQDCNIIFNRSSLILNNSEFLRSLGVKETKSFRKSLETTRFELPIDKIFDTSLNLVLLGEAGAGKTTSLQMYAINNKENDERIILWAPLSKVVHNWSSNSNKIDRETKIKSFDIAICEYLQSKKINLTTMELLELFSKKKFVILFDGLDESIKNNEWLPDAINQLSKKYPITFQIIVTSRTSGSYVEKINFLTVTLLPFTKEQRNQFIKNWFDNKKSDEKFKILEHFKKNKSIDETTRNPLLTTTLCVLAENNLPLPNTEIKLYDNRLALLTGYYDNVKNISSRISTTPDNLEYLAKKIAFYLHTKNIRECGINKLEEISIEFMSNHLSAEMTIIALKELIDPCNIIVPMTENGKFGFGHLRYQEHLAASELMTRRGANIHQLISQNWWKETLILFAQMSDDLLFLTKDFVYNLNNMNYMNTLNEMIKLRPKKEQTEFNHAIKEYTKEFNRVFNDDFDDYLDDDYEM